MKSLFKFYVIIWAILLIAFNIFAFVFPNEIAGINTKGEAFWTGYIFITLSFIGQLICAYFAFKKSNSNSKFFLNIPLISISYTTTIISVIVGTLCMVLPFIPNWIGIILCVIILGISISSILKAQAAAEVVLEVGEIVKVKTQFIKEITVEAQGLISRAENEETKAMCKKVYEALRFSDPMSNEKLYDIEKQINEEFSVFSDAVFANNTEDSKEIAKELICLIDERNKKCKLYK